MRQASAGKRFADVGVCPPDAVRSASQLQRGRAGVVAVTIYGAGRFAAQARKLCGSGRKGAAQWPGKPSLRDALYMPVVAAPLPNMQVASCHPHPRALVRPLAEGIPLLLPSGALCQEQVS